MRFKLIAAGAVAGLFLLAPADADAACCDQHSTRHGQAACCDMPCCKDATQAAEPTAEEILLSMMDPQFSPAPPVRQLAEVWFHRPVLVGKSILQGRYVIDHDNDRMARGEPCTHIYAFNDRTTPVATFHCTHLERNRADQNMVVLVTTSDGYMQRLTEFQFAGETASHGYPTVR